MKRRDQGISNAWSFLLGFVLLTLVVPGVLIGPAQAVRLIASGVSTTLREPTDAAVATGPISHRLPVVEFRSSEKELRYKGVRHPIELEASSRNGVVVQFLDPENVPFGPYERITIAEPQTSDLLAGQLALWLAGRMGVPIVHQELVFLQHDGKDMGIRELSEAVTADVERYRHISDGPVAVYLMRGEAEGAKDPWRSTENWSPAGEMDTETAAQFKELITTLNDTLITNADRRVVLERLIDIETFLRYQAALYMLGANDDALVRMALVRDPRTSKFYPILSDATLIPAAGDQTIASKRDLLGERLMAISDWRVQRDRHIRTAIQDLHVSGAFAERLESVSQIVGPSLTQAGRSRRPLFSMQDPDHSPEALQWSAGDLRSRTAAYWDRLGPMLNDEVGAVNVIVP